jgi:hypothetical protein
MAAYPCPCCGNLTLANQPPGTFEVCPVCFWEDDDVQYRDPRFQGGANKVSLFEARANYAAIGASSPEFVDEVRAPRPEELPGHQAKSRGEQP